MLPEVVQQDSQPIDKVKLRGGIWSTKWSWNYESALHIDLWQRI